MPEERLPPRKPKADPERPQIWAEGAQKPKFDPRAFVVASFHLTRQALSPLLGKTAAASAGFSARVAQGRWRVPAGRLGRAGRLVPSHQRVASWIDAVARILGAAGHSTAPEAVRRRNRFARTASTATVAEPSTRAAGPPASATPFTLPDPDVGPDEDPTRAAIRAALEQSSATGAEPPAAETTSHTAGASPPSRGAATLVSATGTALGWGLTVLAMPYGLVRATFAHLNGDDLRRIRDDD